MFDTLQFHFDTFEWVSWQSHAYTWLFRSINFDAEGFFSIFIIWVVERVLQFVYIVENEIYGHFGIRMSTWDPLEFARLKISWQQIKAQRKLHRQIQTHTHTHSHLTIQMTDIVCLAIWRLRRITHSVCMNKSLSNVLGLFNITSCGTPIKTHKNFYFRRFLHLCPFSSSPSSFRSFFVHHVLFVSMR